jgi:hypothetical protein
MHFRRWKRRAFITLLGATAAWPLAARAQRPDRTRQVGVLMALAQSDPEAQLRAQAFEAGLRGLGWVDGRNLRLDYRWVPETPASCAPRPASSPAWLPT